MPLSYLYVNIATLAVFHAFLFIICNKIWLTCFLSLLCFSLLSVINHYVILFHGMPLSFLQIKNFVTAMNVASSYSFAFDRTVKTILLMALPALSISIFFALFFSSPKKSVSNRLILDLGFLVASFLILFTAYFSETPLKPRNTLGWVWTESYPKYGYVACTVESMERYFNAVIKPDGYSDNAVNQIEISASDQSDTQTPDVILILNESLYDLKVISDITTDIPYFSKMESLDNAVTGYVVVPSRAGGTNNSEYELLTSNSLQLIPGSAPFNYLDLTNANSIVSVMNALGYQTLGSHSEPGVNYSRIRGYAALGFDHCYFDEAFKNKEYYYDRWYETDECIYRNLIRWYEEMPADSPRFLYSLTIQNHGQWNLNSGEYDIVHTSNDYGEYTEDVNEFLTCMYLSDQSFEALTEYFSSQDRPVILCMLGDHCPTIAEQIADPSYSGIEKEIRLRTVPLVIWANFPLEASSPDIMSINYVVPTLMKLGNIPLTPYYQYLLDIKEDAHILTSMGYYLDRAGASHSYTTADPSGTDLLVRDYFYLEYNNLSLNRNQELFLP